MPVIDVPQDPTWEEIADGLEAAAATSIAASMAARTSASEAQRAKSAAEKHRRDQLAADQNFEQWLGKARRKAYKG